MDKQYRQTHAEIDLFRLTQNFQYLRSLLGESGFLCPMVKANAYGHGDIEVSQALVEAGVKCLGVGLVEEGLRLRQADIQIPILVFGPFHRQGARAIIEAGLTPVVQIWEQLHFLSEFVPDRSSLPIHLKFNTGMNRLGFECRDAEAVKDFLVQQSKLDLVGVCSHLSDGEDVREKSGRSVCQWEKLNPVLDVFSSLTRVNHLLNSAALIALRESGNKNIPKQIGARPGLALYGICPQLKPSVETPLKPVMQFKSEVALVHTLRSGERVSYGGVWQADKPSVVGVVPVGYADGYRRGLSNQAVMLFRGQRVPVVGRVCMDYTMVDLSAVADSPDKWQREEIILFGEQDGQEVTAYELADILGTIPYEVVTGIGERVPRVFRGP